MSHIKKAKLLSRSSLLKYRKFIFFRRRHWRNTYMSGDESPIFKLSTGRRRLVRNSFSSNDQSIIKARPHHKEACNGYNSERCQSNDVELSDDDMDCIIFPTVSNIRSEAKDRTEREKPSFGRNIECRRPLRNDSSSDDVLGESCISQSSNINKAKHSLSPRNKTAPYPLVKIRNSSDHDGKDEDSVEFVGEFQPNRSSSSPAMHQKLSSRGSVPSEISCNGKTDTEKIGDIRTFQSANDTPIRKVHITLRVKKDFANSPSENSQEVPMESNKQCSKSPNLLQSPCESQDENRPYRHKSLQAIKSSNNDNGEDDDLVVVQSDEQNIDLPTLKRIVISVVTHFVEDNDVNTLTLEYVMNRLKALYHKDFSYRKSEIKHYIRRGLERCKSHQMEEVRPGIRKSDIDTLSSENWLNDIIINQYMNLIVEDKPKFGAISSFWYEELSREKEPSLPSNWRKLRSILVPTCVDAHWSILCYNPGTNSVQIYSSLPVTSAEARCGRKLLEFFSMKLGVVNEGNCYAPTDLPQQRNEHDCGVYVCMFARCIVCGNSFDIKPEQVIEFRQWLKDEIVRGELMG